MLICLAWWFWELPQDVVSHYLHDCRPDIYRMSFVTTRYKRLASTIAISQRRKKLSMYFMLSKQHATIGFQMQREFFQEGCLQWGFLHLPPLKGNFPRTITIYNRIKRKVKYNNVQSIFTIIIDDYNLADVIFNNLSIPAAFKSPAISQAAPLANSWSIKKGNLQHFKTP